MQQIKKQIEGVFQEEVVNMIRDAVLNYASEQADQDTEEGVRNKSSIIDDVVARFGSEQQPLVDKLVGLLVPHTSPGVEHTNEQLGGVFI
jgi:hypothetical protein